MEARKFGLVSDESDENDGTATVDEEAVVVPVWVYGLQLGPALQGAYGYIYGRTLSRDCESFDTDLAELSGVFGGKDRRTVDGWLAALEAAPVSLIRVAADALTGRLRITCFRPVAFAPRRATKRGRDPQRHLPGLEDEPPSTACPVAPIVASKVPAGTTDDSDRAAVSGTTPRPPRMSPGESAQNPPRLAGDFAQKPPGDSAQNPPSDVLELQRKLDLKRSQAFVTRTSGAQKPPAWDVRARDLDLRSLVSVSVSETEIETRDLRAGEFAQKPPSAPGRDGYGVGMPLAALTRQIQRDVGPALQRTVAHKVAAAICEGHVDGDEVAAVIRRAHDLVSGGRCPSAFVYFVSTMRAIFTERKVPWQSGRPTRRR